MNSQVIERSVYIKTVESYFAALDERLDEQRPAREEHRICGGKVVVFCAPRDHQDEEAHVDDAHHAVRFAALATQVEVESREPDGEGEGEPYLSA